MQGPCGSCGAEQLCAAQCPRQLGGLDERLRRWVAEHGLPGARPYSRRMDTRARAEHRGMPVGEFLLAKVRGGRGGEEGSGLRRWRGCAAEGRLLLRRAAAEGEAVLSPEELQSTTVQPGDVVVHVEEGWTEPEVCTAVRTLWVDQSLVCVHKPAPLPVHRGGRFTRNTLLGLCERAWPDLGPLLPANRLDADTAGVLLLARGRGACAALQAAFRGGLVRKAYLAEVSGRPPAGLFECREALSHGGGDGTPRPSLTRFAAVEGTPFLLAEPLSGRTHQIRLHCRALGLPIRGDSTYAGAAPAEAGRSVRNALCGESQLRLHCAATVFPHPASAAVVSLRAELPQWAAEGGPRAAERWCDAQLPP
eukprot:TRINITY_DN33064_c0_g2_i1.p2 TRINITY_DN33064_c0_g2~~TRINITY_DN33064_c0_g2_i1.p2  ORF type:complete len:387 (+),score=112.42 TRINITY_DN33064_c0_g2_i1:71-1162(+)